MSILSFTRKTSSGEGDMGLDGADRRSLTFTARTDVITTIDAIKAGGPFQQGSYFVDRGATKLSLVCDGIKPKQISDLVWEVQYNFSSHPITGREPAGAYQTDPILRLPEVSWGQEEVHRPAQTAYRVVDNTLDPLEWTWTDPEAVVNSAKGRYPQGLPRTRNRSVLNYTRNELTFPKYYAGLYMGKVNSTSWLGDQAYQWKCKSITGQWVWETLPSGLVGYWKVAYVFVFDPVYWIEDVLDEGNFALDYANGAYSVTGVKTPKKLPMAGPVPLDGAGAQLSGDLIQAGSLIYRTYLDGNGLIDFNALAITIPP